MSFLWARPPRVVGHRGSPREAPENTMASFRAAVAAGARAIELDVRLTADREIVIHHDDWLGRTVPGEGPIDALAAKDLLARDAGSWFAPAYRDERVPTLGQVLRELPPSLLLDVELKADAESAYELPALVHRALDQAGALDRALVTSFDPGLADEYARLSGRPAGAILPFAPQPGDLDAWPRLTHVALSEDAATPEALAVCAREKRTTLVWTVNDPESAEALLKQGVASVITDRPGALLARIPEAEPAR